MSMFVILLLCVVLLVLAVRNSIRGNTKTFWACVITVLVVDLVVAAGLVERIAGALL